MGLRGAAWSCAKPTTSGNPMNIHQRAALTPLRREQMVVAILQDGLSRKDAAAAFRLSPRTVAKWLARYCSGGVAALADRSSRPRRLHRPTPLCLQEEVITLRRQKLTGSHIAVRTGLSRATVSRILRRARLSRWRDSGAGPARRALRAPAPGRTPPPRHQEARRHRSARPPPYRRSAHPRPCRAGWEYVFVAIDDHSRLAHAAIHPNEQAASAVAFLREAVAHYERFGIKLQRVMTDNGPCFHARAFGRACRELGIRHVRTRPYTPRTNGKAERFIQSSLREWAYGSLFTSSAHRAEGLPRWLHRYNWHRPHSSLGLNLPSPGSSAPRTTC